MTPFLWGFEQRELLMEFYERVERRAAARRLFPSRRRASGHAGRPHRRHRAPGPRSFPRCIDDIEGLLTENRIFKQRTVDIGMVSAAGGARLGLHRADAARLRRAVGPAQGAALRRLRAHGFRHPRRQERRLLRPLSRAHGGDAPEPAGSSGSAWQQMPAGPVKVDDRKIAPPPRARDEALDGGAHPSLQALHRGLSTCRRARPTRRSRRPRASSASISSPTAATSPIAARSARPASPICRRWISSAKRPHAGRRGGDPRLHGHRLRRDRSMSGAQRDVADSRRASPSRPRIWSAREADHRQVPAGTPGQRGAAAARPGAAPERRLAAARGDGPCRRDARDGADPRLRGRDLLHDVQPEAGRPLSCSRCAAPRPAGCAAPTS